MTITYETINEFRHATKYPVLNLDMTLTIYCHCPNCRTMFKEAPRCPECGQLVVMQKKPAHRNPNVRKGPRKSI